MTFDTRPAADMFPADAISGDTEGAGIPGAVVTAVYDHKAEHARYEEEQRLLTLANLPVAKRADIKSAVWRKMEPLLQAFAEHTLGSEGKAYECSFTRLPERQKEVPSLVKPFGTTIGTEMQIAEKGKNSFAAQKAVGEGLLQLVQETPELNSSYLADTGLFSRNGEGKMEFPKKWGGVPETLNASLEIYVRDGMVMPFVEAIAQKIDRTDLLEPIKEAFAARVDMQNAEAFAVIKARRDAWDGFIR